MFKLLSQTLYLLTQMSVNHKLIKKMSGEVWDDFPNKYSDGCRMVNFLVSPNLVKHLKVKHSLAVKQYIGWQKPLILKANGSIQLTESTCTTTLLYV